MAVFTIIFLSLFFTENKSWHFIWIVYQADIKFQDCFLDKNTRILFFFFLCKIIVITLSIGADGPLQTV